MVGRSSSNQQPTRKCGPDYWRGTKASSPERFDLLMLLSKDDPFGMVVVEALQHGVPCILSKGVGAGRHLKEGIITFNGKFDTSFLSDFISIINSRLPPQTWWSWKDLARWHITEIYTPLLKVHDAHQRKIKI